MRPTLSVVIPSYNGRHLLAPCLASLARHRPTAIPTQVIVSDDASTDDTAAWLAARHPDVHLVRLDRNRGFCAAANAGIAAASGAFVQLLNNDAEVTSGWAEAGLAPFADPAVGSVAPLVLMRDDPSTVDSAGDGYALIGWPFKRGHGQPAARWADRTDDRVLGASASSAFYRAEALRRVGGFDPAYGSYYEDVDLAFRLRWAGYACAFAPKCRVLHDVSASFDHGRADLQRRVARNAEYLFWTNLPGPRLALALLPHAAFTLAQVAWRLARGRGRPLVLGKLDALRDWRSLARGRRHRRELAASAPARPHFPTNLAALGPLGDHLRRYHLARRPASGR